MQEEHPHTTTGLEAMPYGMRLTRQRRVVLDALVAMREHPTAGDIFLHVKEQMPSISLATVYNCLETLTRSGMVRQVNLDRAPSRYCANMQNHGHFYCDSCGRVMDVHLQDPDKLAECWQLPAGSIVKHHEWALRGVCPECNTVSATQ